MIPEAIIFDRDGTLIVDKEYVHKIEELQFFPRVVEALQKIDKKTKIIIITNQAGIGKGIFIEQDYLKFRNHIWKVLEDRGITIAAEYFCPHHPKGIAPYNVECNCRKPKSGLFEQAIEEHGLSSKNCWNIGDMRRDIIAGQKLGMKGILVKTGFGGQGGDGDLVIPEYVAEDVYDAIEFIRKK